MTTDSTRGPEGPTGQRSRRGAMLPHAVATVVVAIVVAAFVADIGFLRTAQSQVQNAADAGAHAGARELDGTGEGMMKAAARARQLVLANPTMSGGSGGGDPEVEVRMGSWRNGFTTESDPRRVTTVQVDVLRPGVRYFFAPMVFGKTSGEVAGLAGGLGGGPGAAACVLPIGIPDCGLPTGSAVCNYDVVLNADGNDTGGWALLGSSRPNASTVRSMLEGCIDADLSDLVTLNNGTINSALNKLTDVVNAQTTYWDTEAWGTQPAKMSRSAVTPYGKVLRGKIIVFDDPADCRGTKYNGTSLPLAGFASTVIYDTATSGPVGDRKIKVRVTCDLDDAIGGGGYFGTRVRPSLVQ